MRPATRCFSCGARGLIPFHEQRCVPISSSAVLGSRQEALSFPRGDIRLAFCASCGFVENVLFDPRRLEGLSWPGSEDEDSTTARALAQQLVERYDLYGKDVLDIGGDGAFLAELCRLGANRGVGIDGAAGAAPAAGSAEFIAGRFSLDRTQRVGDLVRLLRRSISEQRAPVLFFEVADFEQALSDLAFWAVRYERCSYFSLGSLARLFRKQAFQVFDLRRPAEGGSLRLEVAGGAGQDGPFWEDENDIERLKRLVAQFRDQSATRLHAWGKTLQRVHDNGQRAVIWGAGGQTRSLLGAVDTGQDLFVIDAAAEGSFLPGYGNEIAPPEFLRDYRPDVVISVQPESADGIWLDLRFRGLEPELIVL